MEEQFYSLKLKVVAEAVVPEGCTDDEMPEQTISYEVCTLFEAELPASKMAQDGYFETSVTVGFLDPEEVVAACQELGAVALTHERRRLGLPIGEAKEAA